MSGHASCDGQRLTPRRVLRGCHRGAAATGQRLSGHVAQYGRALSVPKAQDELLTKRDGLTEIEGLVVGPAGGHRRTTRCCAVKATLQSGLASIAPLAIRHALDLRTAESGIERVVAREPPRLPGSIESDLLEPIGLADIGGAIQVEYAVDGLRTLGQDDIAGKGTFGEQRVGRSEQAA